MNTESELEDTIRYEMTPKGLAAVRAMIDLGDGKGVLDVLSDFWDVAQAEARKERQVAT